MQWLSGRSESYETVFVTDVTVTEMNLCVYVVRMHSDATASTSRQRQKHNLQPSAEVPR